MGLLGKIFSSQLSWQQGGEERGGEVEEHWPHFCFHVSSSVTVDAAAVILAP